MIYRLFLNIKYFKIFHLCPSQPRLFWWMECNATLLIRFCMFSSVRVLHWNMCIVLAFFSVISRKFNILPYFWSNLDVKKGNYFCVVTLSSPLRKDIFLREERKEGYHKTSPSTSLWFLPNVCEISFCCKLLFHLMFKECVKKWILKNEAHAVKKVTQMRASISSLFELPLP